MRDLQTNKSKGYGFVSFVNYQVGFSLLRLLFDFTVEVCAICASLAKFFKVGCNDFIF